MNLNKIVIALFGKLKGHVIDWFDLKYVYPHHTVAKIEHPFWAKNMIFQGFCHWNTIILYNYVFNANKRFDLLCVSWNDFKRRNN